MEALTIVKTMHGVGKLRASVAFIVSHLLREADGVVYLSAAARDEALDALRLIAEAADVPIDLDACAARLLVLPPPTPPIVEGRTDVTYHHFLDDGHHVLRIIDELGPAPTLVMDHENSSARGWSHVLSLTDDVAALDAFRVRIGAPPSALQRPPRARHLHLDICRGPRRRALALDGVAVTVYRSTLALMRAYRTARGTT